MKKDSIIIAFAVNDEYVPYLEVAITSIVDNANSDKIYEIYILHKNLLDDNKEKICQLINGIETFSVEFLCVSEYFNMQLYVGNNGIQYLSEETYYRLALTELLPRFKKVIYLDCDIVVLSDIAELYEYEINDYYFAAVSDIADNWKCYSDKSDVYIYRKNELSMNNPEKYFNAGVLLINLEKMRNDYSVNGLLYIAQSRKWEKHDQDILNMIAKGKVKWLDIQWNLIECCNIEKISDKDREYYFSQQKYPKIIHFASRKPWIFSGVFGQETFWKYASKTPDYMKCIKSISGEKQLRDSRVLQRNVLKAIEERNIGLPFLLSIIKTWLKIKLKM